MRFRFGSRLRKLPSGLPFPRFGAEEAGIRNRPTNPNCHSRDGEFLLRTKVAFGRLYLTSGRAGT